MYFKYHSNGFTAHVLTFCNTLVLYMWQMAHTDNWGIGHLRFNCTEVLCCVIHVHTSHSPLATKTQWLYLSKFLTMGHPQGQWLYWYDFFDGPKRGVCSYGRSTRQSDVSNAATVKNCSFFQNFVHRDIIWNLWKISEWLDTKVTDRGKR